MKLKILIFKAFVKIFFVQFLLKMKKSRFWHFHLPNSFLQDYLTKIDHFRD